MLFAILAALISFIAAFASWKAANGMGYAAMVMAPVIALFGVVFLVSFGAVLIILLTEVIDHFRRKYPEKEKPPTP